MRFRTWILLGCLLLPAVVRADVVVTVEGVAGELRHNILESLTLVREKDDPVFDEVRLKRLYARAVREIELALRPFGYYRPRISSDLQGQGKDWRVSFVVDAGPPVLIEEADVRLEGAVVNDPLFQEFMRRQPLRVGAIMDHRVYEEVKSGLAKLAAERGYLGGRFVRHEMIIDLERYTARVALHYDSGERLKFGAVFFHQDRLDDSLLQGFVPFPPGEPYTMQRLLELQQALNDSDYFSTVEVRPDYASTQDGNVPVDVNLGLRPRHKYTLGLGYGTDTGARGRVGWEMPYLNAEGHRIGSDLKVTEISSELSLRYRVPGRNPRLDEYIYSGVLSREHTDTAISAIRRFGWAYNHARGAWRESLSLNFHEERFTVGLDEGRTTLLMPGVGWSRIWGEERINARQGARLNLSLRGATKTLLSDSDFAQGTLRLKEIVPAGRRARWVAQAALGASWTPDFEALPASVRFFAGGAQSVRGYSYNSLGPKDASGQVSGGKHLLLGSLEYEHGVTPTWGGAVFYDVGNAMDVFTDPLKHGAGIGVRWKSPVGPVRLDLAWALSENGTPWRLHFNIGPDL